MIENEANLKDTTRKLVENRKKIGLTMNEDKTKYMVIIIIILIIRNNHRMRQLNIGEYKFKSVDNFKYLGMAVKKGANSHEKIKD